MMDVIIIGAGMFVLGVAFGYGIYAGRDRQTYKVAYDKMQMRAVGLRIALDDAHAAIDAHRVWMSSAQHQALRLNIRHATASRARADG